MKLYYSKGACSLVVNIIIHELGLKAEFEAVDLQTQKTESGKNFLDITAKGSVPCLECDNGQILTENAVILQYLADSAKATTLLPPVNDFKRYRVLEWLNYMATELHKSLGTLFNPAITEEMRTQIYFPLITKRLSFLDNHLKNHAFLLGDEFTLPDAYLFVMLRWASYFKFPLNQYTHLVKYFANVNHRPAVQQALKQEGL